MDIVLDFGHNTANSSVNITYDSSPFSLKFLQHYDPLPHPLHFSILYIAFLIIYKGDCTVTTNTAAA